MCQNWSCWGGLPSWFSTRASVSVSPAIVQLNDVRSDEPVLLWEDKAFSRRTSYQVDPRAEDYFDRQNIAMDVLSKEFSSALVTAVLEGF